MAELSEAIEESAETSTVLAAPMNAMDPDIESAAEEELEKLMADAETDSTLSLLSSAPAVPVVSTSAAVTSTAKHVYPSTPGPASKQRAPVAVLETPLRPRTSQPNMAPSGSSGSVAHRSTPSEELTSQLNAISLDSTVRSPASAKASGPAAVAAAAPDDDELQRDYERLLASSEQNVAEEKSKTVQLA